MITVYEYIGEEVMTRGEFGVRVRGGHSRPEDPSGIYVTDPDFGDMYFGSIPDPDFVEIGQEERTEFPPVF